jgi:hypothetical protein
MKSMTQIAAVSSWRAISAMMISKLKTPGVVGGLLVGLVLGTAMAALFSATPPARAQVQAPPATPASALPKQQDTNKALAEAQLKLARQALDVLGEMQMNGTLDNLESRFAVWRRRQVEALRASGVGKGELVTALEDYLKQMKDLSLNAEERRKQARITYADLLECQYLVLEAEMWLNQEKLR